MLLSELEDDPVTDSGHADEVAVGVEFCGEGLVLPTEAELDEAEEEEEEDEDDGAELAPVVAADPV